MTLADQAKATVGRVLVYDIETSPTVTFTFGMTPKWISPEKIIDPSRVMSVAAKWVDDPEILFHAEYNYRTRKLDRHDRMIRNVWALFDKAEACVSFNGTRFDAKHLRREWALAGLAPPSPWKEIDLYRVAKASFSFESSSLNHLAQRFDIGSKVQHTGFQLWRDCLAGDHAAWHLMREYNTADVDLTEALYEKLKPWIRTHPHLSSQMDDRPTCNRCPDGGDLEAKGTYLAQQIRYRRYQCRTCGGWVRGTRHSRAAVTHGI